MTNEQKVTLFKQIVNQMADLYEKKNKNYGDSFGKLYNDLGPIAGLVPLHNKLDRATNLVRGGENNFESLEDTFKDLACYAIMNLIEIINAKTEMTSYPGESIVGNVYTTQEPGDKIDEYYDGFSEDYEFDPENTLYINNNIFHPTENEWDAILKFLTRSKGDKNEN